MAVEPVQVEYAFSGMRNKDIQVSRLQRDGFLLVKGDPEEWIQSNPADLLSVRFLELQFVEKIGDSIGQLSHLTQLSIYGQNLKFLPNSISSLPNLQRLELSGCPNLQELPANLGDLNSLTFLYLYKCNSIKSLPHSISKLSNLTSLHLICCESLEELPAISNVAELPDNHCSCGAHLKELPPSLWELSELLTLNIQDTTIKWLPWSITELSKLRLLSLPEHFRLKTLPEHLNDSIVISVEDTHIRKTWQQLKTD